MATMMMQMPPQQPGQMTQQTPQQMQNQGQLPPPGNQVGGTGVHRRTVPVGSGKKPRGKMTPYACFVKVIRAEHKKKHPNEHIVFAEFSKKCAEKWSQMTDKEKRRFQEMSLKDKERYEREMSEYEPPAGEKTKPKKKKRTKDPNAPKRALSAFMWFCKDARKDVKIDSPDLKMGEIAKVLSGKWKNCLDKSPYEASADTDKLRYATQMKLYKSQKAAGIINPIIPAVVPSQQVHPNMMPTHVPVAPPVQQKPMESESESDESGSEDDDDEEDDA